MGASKTVMMLAGAIAAAGGAFRRALFDLIDRRLRAPRLRTTAFLLGAGIALALCSMLLGSGAFRPTCDQVATLCASLGDRFRERELGFLTAPNWSVTILALWPLMFYVLRSMLDAAERVFEDIDASPMAWLAAPATKQPIGATWRRQKIYLRRWVTLFLVVSVGASLWEWFTASGAPLLSGTPPREGELDWSSIPSGQSRLDTLRALFTLAAFIYQGVAVALMASFAVAVILMARTVGLHGSGEAAPPLLVDIESNDPAKRGGFERFIVVIDYMIVFVFLAFVNFFLTRLQNAYLRDYDSSSLGEMIARDFVVLDVQNIGQLFDAGSADFSSAAVAIGAVLALFQCFFFFNATLRHAALQSRNRADHALMRSPLKERAAETALEPAQVRERLQEINVWPLGYSDLMPTLSFLTICGVTIVFYRIGIYLVFLWIAGWILARAAQGLIRRG